MANKIDHLRLVANFMKPWIIIDDNNFNDCARGIQCQLIRYLSKSLNFTYHIINETYGYKLKDGNWTGMIGRIQKNEADMTASPFNIREDYFNENIVDFSHLFGFEESVVMTSLDDSEVVTQMSIKRVFTTISLVIFMCLYCMVVLVLIFLGDYFLQYKINNLERFIGINLKLLAFELSQDAQLTRTFKNTLPVLILLTCYLFSVQQLAYLESSLITSRSSLKIPSKQINTIDELVKSDMNLVVLQTFKYSNKKLNNDTLLKIEAKYKKINSNLPFSRIMSESKWIVDTSYGRSAIFLYEVPLKTTAIIHSKSLKPNTKFRFIDEKYENPFILTIASSRRLPKYFRDEINLRVSRYYSTGIIGHDLEQLLYKSQPFFDYKQRVDNNFTQISLQSITYFFRTFLIGLSICTMVAFIEIIYFYVKFVKIIKLRLFKLYRVNNMFQTRLEVNKESYIKNRKFSQI